MKLTPSGTLVYIIDNHGDTINFYNGDPDSGASKLSSFSLTDIKSGTCGTVISDTAKSAFALVLIGNILGYVRRDWIRLPVTRHGKQYYEGITGLNA